MYLIPQPKEFRTHPGSFILSCNSRITLLTSCPPEAYAYARMLQEEMEFLLGYSLPVNRGTAAVPGIVWDMDASLDREEYRITVDGQGIRAAGGSPAGLFYSMQTLKQILKQTGPCIPCLEIRDFPDMPARGFYHDVTRGRIPTLAQLKKLADKLASYKLNQLHLYMEHSFLLEGFSEVWRDDTPLTPEDILELDTYCRERFIDLVPSIASFGHLYKVLRTRSCRHLCELPEEIDQPFGFMDRMRHHTLDVSNPDSMALVKKIIDAFLPLFSCKYFNIGADETFDLGKGNSRRLAREKGTVRLYVDFVRELCEYVVSKGKIPMFWGDIICSAPETIGELPPETICLNWGYAADVEETSTRKLAEAGAVLYNCPGVSGWDQMVNKIRVSYENIRRMGSYAFQYGAAGILTTDWGDCGHINHPDFSVTGLIYGAAISWNKEFPPYGEINRQISILEFTDKTGGIVSLLAQVSENQRFTWRDLVKFKEGEAEIARNIPADTEADSRRDSLKQNQIFSETGSALENLDAITEKLYALLPSLDTSMRPAIKPYLTAIQGLKLIQQIGLILHARDASEEPPQGIDPWELASRLECWFMDYKEDWRKVSRESELFRIQEVIHFYADYLRS